MSSNKRRNSSKRRKHASREPKREYSNLHTNEYQYREKKRVIPKNANRSKLLKKYRPFLIGTAVAGVGIISFLYIRISEVKVFSEVNSETIRQERYESLVEDHLSSFWGSYSLFDREVLSQALQAEYSSEIAGITTVKKNFFGSLDVFVELRTPLFSYGGGEVPSNPSLFIDSSGYVTSLVGNTEEKSTDQLVHLRDTSSISREGPVLTQSTVEFTQEITSELRSREVDISYIDVTDSAIRQISIYIEGEKYYVLVHTETDPQVIAEDLQVALDSFEDKSNDTPKKYLDMRIPGEAVYR